MMRKYMRPLAVLLFLIINFSSLSAQNAKVIREGSKLFLVERGRKYDPLLGYLPQNTRRYQQH